MRKLEDIPSWALRAIVRHPACGDAVKAACERELAKPDRRKRRVR